MYKIRNRVPIIHLAENTNYTFRNRNLQYKLFTLLFILLTSKVLFGVTIVF